MSAGFVLASCTPRTSAQFSSKVEEHRGIAQSPLFRRDDDGGPEGLSSLSAVVASDCKFVEAKARTLNEYDPLECDMIGLTWNYN